MHQFFSQHCKKRKRWVHQTFNKCWQMVSCWFMLLMLYLRCTSMVECMINFILTCSSSFNLRYLSCIVSTVGIQIPVNQNIGKNSLVLNCIWILNNQQSCLVFRLGTKWLPFKNWICFLIFVKTFWFVMNTKHSTTGQITIQKPGDQIPIVQKI